MRFFRNSNQLVIEVILSNYKNSYNAISFHPKHLDLFLLYKILLESKGWLLCQISGHPQTCFWTQDSGPTGALTSGWTTEYVLSYLLSIGNMQHMINIDNHFISLFCMAPLVTHCVFMFQYNFISCFYRSFSSSNIKCVSL